jgi:hypothetical protein
MSISSDRVKKWRKDTKSYMVNAMGGKCICCGYNKCNEALEFHHLNPEQKKFGFGKIRANPTTWNIIVEELKKCILVCANCHREIEAGLIQAVFDSTFDVKYEQIKTEPYRTPALDRKCKTCKNSLKTFNKQKRYCSEECRPTLSSSPSPRSRPHRVLALPVPCAMKSTSTRIETVLICWSVASSFVSSRFSS